MSSRTNEEQGFVESTNQLVRDLLERVQHLDLESTTRYDKNGSIPPDHVTEFERFLTQQLEDNQVELMILKSNLTATTNKRTPPEDMVNTMYKPIISNMWFLKPTGSSLYTFVNPNSTDPREIDPYLFSGLISALSIFVRETTKKEMEYIKIRDEIIVLYQMEDLIVTTIINQSLSSEIGTVTRYLAFLANHFKINFMVDGIYPEDINEVKNQFDPQMEFLVNDREIYEIFKIEELNEALNSVLEGIEKPSKLYWTFVTLFYNFSPEKLNETFEIFKNMFKAMRPNVPDQSKVKDVEEVLERVEPILKLRLTGLEMQDLVKKSNMKLVNAALDKFVFEAIFCLNFLEEKKDNS